MTAQIIPFPKAAHASRAVADSDPLWNAYQRDMTMFLETRTQRAYIRAAMSYGEWCVAFDPESAEQNIEAFHRKHGVKFEAAS